MIQTKSKLTSLATAVLFFCMIIAVFIMPTYAEDTKAHLYFYTCDDEEIESLKKNISSKKEYTFPDADDYTYLPYEDDNGDMVYNENKYEVNGIGWKVIDQKTGNEKIYNPGDKCTFEPGEYVIRCVSDNPSLTGENTYEAKSDSMVYLYFYTSDGQEIPSLYKEIASGDKYTFENPNVYTYTTNPDEDAPDDAEYEGIYWGTTTDSGKSFLFEDGNVTTFKGGAYEFKVITNKPVQINFSYPLNVDTYFVSDVDNNGEFYATYTYRAGQKINLLKSLGAIVWGSTFKGWEEMNTDYASYKDVWSGGSSFTIMTDEDLSFFAVYEEDENWDPYAIDENGMGKESIEEILVDTNALSASGGLGLTMAVDSTGKLVGGSTMSAIKSKWSIKDDPSLSPLKDGVEDTPENRQDPNNYKYDKYGRLMEGESNLDPEWGNIMHQDNSAQYLDVYGNSFIYYDVLSGDNGEYNKQLAIDRMSLSKTSSFVANVQDILVASDSDAIVRFETIEFALLGNHYPTEGEVVTPSTITGDDVLTWKTEYMSEKAFKELKTYRNLFKGWMDNYDDGIYQKYKDKATGGSGSGVVGSISDIINNIFGITAYAEDSSTSEWQVPETNPTTTGITNGDTNTPFTNSLGFKNQLFSQMNMSFGNAILSTNESYAPQYYNPSAFNMSSYYGMYSFGQIMLKGSPISAETTKKVTQVFNTLIKEGYSESAAAGVIGNLLVETTTLDPTAENSAGYYGIVQWDKKLRKENLINYCAENNLQYDTFDGQLAFMVKELKDYDGKLNTACHVTYIGTAFKSIEAADVAAKCVAMGYEGCTGGSVDDGGAEYNNQMYQQLQYRVDAAVSVYGAMTHFAYGDGKQLSLAELTGGQFSSIWDIAAAYSNLSASSSRTELSRAFLGANHNGTGDCGYKDYKNDWITFRTIILPCDANHTLKEYTVWANKLVIDQFIAGLVNINETNPTFYIQGGELGGLTPKCIKGANGKDKLDTISYHSTGMALDINWTTNRNSSTIDGVYSNGFRPYLKPTSITSEMAYSFISQGATWGIGFSGNYDPMHFAFGEGNSETVSRYATVYNNTLNKMLSAGELTDLSGKLMQ